MIISNKAKLVVPKGKKNVTMVYTPMPVADTTTQLNLQNIQDKLADLTKQVKK